MQYRFSIKYTSSLNDFFADSGVVFIKYVPNKTGQYNITGIDSYTWYSEDLNIRYGDLTANQTYYLMIEGKANDAYNINIEYQEKVRTEIPLRVGVERSTGKYYFVVEQDGNYTFKTYRNSDEVSSTISVYSMDGTEYISNVCTDLYLKKIYLTVGTYYLDLSTTPNNQTVTIRINITR